MSVLSSSRVIWISIAAMLICAAVIVAIEQSFPIIDHDAVQTCISHIKADPEIKAAFGTIDDVQFERKRSSITRYLRSRRAVGMYTLHVQGPRKTGDVRVSWELNNGKYAITGVVLSN